MANTVEKGLVSKSALTAIGDAIRAKNGSTTKYKPSEMAAAISELKTGDFAVATSDKFTYKVVQSANQIITSTPVGKSINNQDGTISLILTDDTTVSPNTNYIPGTISRSYDDNTHTYTVTATDAEPIDGLVQDGWSVLYQKNPNDSVFYSKANYTGTSVSNVKLQGNILIGGMKVVSADENRYNPPADNKNILKFKNSFLTSAGNSLLRSCSVLTSVELPNLTSAGDYMLDGVGNSSSSINFIDFGHLTKTSYNNSFYYTRVMVFRADTVPTGFTESRLSDPVLYIVPSALVDTYKSKVRSRDYVTALEKSPFADGKTVCGNNMKTRYNNADFSDIPDPSTKVLVYRPNTQTNGSWEYSSKKDVSNSKLFSFWSKLTEEMGYTIPT